MTEFKPEILIFHGIKPRRHPEKGKLGPDFANSLLNSLGCTPVVRHENWEQVGRHVRYAGGGQGVKRTKRQPKVGRHVRYAGGGRGCKVAMPAKRKRALLRSNPPRNSQPETHGDAAGAGGHARRRRLVMAWGAGARGHGCITVDFRMPCKPKPGASAAAEAWCRASNSAGGR
jgi:hypothetical protein